MLVEIPVYRCTLERLGCRTCRFAHDCKNHALTRWYGKRACEDWQPAPDADTTEYMSCEWDEYSVNGVNSQCAGCAKSYREYMYESTCED